MAVSILDIDDFESNDFNIIALHTSLEDYKLAYLINKTCHLNLAKELTPLTLSKFDINTNFDFFKFEDETEKVIWSLIANKSALQPSVPYLSNTSSEQKKIYSDIVLIPEYDTVDFFIKIEESINTEVLNRIITTIKQIKGIQAVYELDKNTLVSINNLLF